MSRLLTAIVVGLLLGVPVLQAQSVTVSGDGATTTYHGGTGTSSLALHGVVSTHYLMLLGDSKTASGSPWFTPLVANLRITPGGRWLAVNGGVSGTTVASTVTSLSTILTPMPDVAVTDVVTVLMNWGANDVGILPAEAPWEANYLILIDAAVAKWPGATVYLARAWRQGFDANCDTLATRIDHLVAARPGVVFLGPDERIYIKGSDNGVSETADGTHYSNPLGQALEAAAWQAVLWP